MNQDYQTKICNKCKIKKNIFEFNIRTDRNIPRKECKSCQSLYSSIWRNKNKEKRKEIRKKEYQIYKEKNKIKIQKDRKLNPEKYKIFRKRDRLKNKKWYKNYHKKYQNQRRNNDLLFKIIGNYRHRTWGLLKNNKSLHTNELLGCNYVEFRWYIEQQFTEGMSWDNYGNKEGQWSIDHIIPCDWFKNNTDILNDVSDQKRCFHYTNCRPMWHITNIQKNNKINGLNLIYKNNTPFI